MSRFLGFLLIGLWVGTARAVEWKDGDIIFQTSRSSQSRAIQLATHSPYSHLGILYKAPKGWAVFEAIQPVTYTPALRWIKRGDGGHYVIKRLKDPSLLTPDAQARLKQAGRGLQGKPYDLYFGWSDDRVYCSELVWKVYKTGLDVELSPLRRLRDFDLSPPAVQQKMKERYGSSIPLDEWVVSPKDIYDSPFLMTVESK